jgi:hypothetical protein
VLLNSVATPATPATKTGQYNSFVMPQSVTGMSFMLFSGDQFWGGRRLKLVKDSKDEEVKQMSLVVSVFPAFTLVHLIWIVSFTFARYYVVFV